MHITRTDRIPAELLQPNDPLNVRRLFEIEYLPRRKTIERKTRQKMDHEITRWERLTGDPPVAALSSDTFNGARAEWLAGGGAADTIETTIGTVLTVLRHAARYGVIPTVPDAGEKLRRITRRRAVPTVADLDAIYRRADLAKWPKFAGVTAGDFWRSWICGSFFTGLRLTDQMQRVYWENLSEDSLAVKANKTGKFHVFPMPAVFRRHLELMRPLGDGRVWPVSKSPHIIRRELRRFCEAAGVAPVITPQAMRRAAGTQWQKAKWGAGQTLLGHTLGVSDRYIAPEILHEAVRVLDVPPAFLTPEESRDRAASRQRLLKTFDQLDQKAQEMVADLIDRLLN